MRDNRTLTSQSVLTGGYAAVFAVGTYSKHISNDGCATFFSSPQIRRGYPLNLSILISGGKETNKDSPSNGE